MIESLQKAYSFSSHFNEQIYLRYCLFKNGFWQENRKLPSLYEIEKNSMLCILNMNIQVFKTKSKLERPAAILFLDSFIE